MIVSHHTAQASLKAHITRLSFFSHLFPFPFYEIFFKIGIVRRSFRPDLHVSFDLRVLCQSEKNTGFLFSRFHLRVEAPFSESQGSVVPFPDPGCSSVLMSPFGPLPNYPENAVVYVVKRCLCYAVTVVAASEVTHFPL